jgi:hypothetical protein
LNPTFPFCRFHPSYHLDRAIIGSNHSIKIRRAALPARSRAYSERLHSEPFGRQRPGANRRSIKQFFTPSKQTAASNKSYSLVAQLA